MLSIVPVTALYSPTVYKGSIFFMSLPALLFVFLMVVILARMRWNLKAKDI